MRFTFPYHSFMRFTFLCHFPYIDPYFFSHSFLKTSKNSRDSNQLLMTFNFCGSISLAFETNISPWIRSIITDGWQRLKTRKPTLLYCLTYPKRLTGSGLMSRWGPNVQIGNDDVRAASQHPEKLGFSCRKERREEKPLTIKIFIRIDIFPHLRRNKFNLSNLVHAGLIWRKSQWYNERTIADMS